MEKEKQEELQRKKEAEEDALWHKVALALSCVGWFVFVSVTDVSH